jgi:hypothetical protein
MYLFSIHFPKDIAWGLTMGKTPALGEVIGGNLSRIEVALTHQDIVKDLPQVGFGDFVGIDLKEKIRIIGVVGSIAFEGYKSIQPLGMSADVRESIMPDLEDVVYSSVIKKATVPILGYVIKNKPTHGIPKFLPEIHDLTHILSPPEIQAFHSVNSNFEMGYMSRLLQEDIAFPIDLISEIYKTLQTISKLEERDFLVAVKRGFLEARGIDIPAVFAANLNRRMQR